MGALNIENEPAAIKTIFDDAVEQVSSWLDDQSSVTVDTLVATLDDVNGAYLSLSSVLNYRTDDSRTALGLARVTRRICKLATTAAKNGGCDDGTKQKIVATISDFREWRAAFEIIFDLFEKVVDIRLKNTILSINN